MKNLNMDKEPGIAQADWRKNDRFRLRDGAIGNFEAAAIEAIAYWKAELVRSQMRLQEFQGELKAYKLAREETRGCACGQIHPGFLGNCICGDSYAHHLKIYEDSSKNHHCDLCNCPIYRYDRRFLAERRQSTPEFYRHTKSKGDGQ